jgi:hypothetical protein
MDKALIGAAIAALELVDIHLYSTSVKRYESISNEQHPDDMLQQNKVSVDVEFLESEEEENIGTRIINAKVSFGLRFAVENEDDEMTVFSEIESCFLAKYFQNKELSEEAVSEFMKYNVIHNVWPFWREHAFRISAEARLPKPMIPLFKQQPTSK